jgi:hypothetical protein
VVVSSCEASTLRLAACSFENPSRY